MLNHTYYHIDGDTTNVKTEVHLNNPSTGFIQKSNPVSRFIRFQRGSEIEKKLFPTDPRETPKLTYVTCENKPDWEHPEDRWRDRRVEKEHFEEVIILQVCIFGNDYMLAEYVFKHDMKDESDK